jgi:hypothetical protein
LTELVREPDNARGDYVSGCGRKILFIFGGLLVAAGFLFIPYRQTTTSTQYNSSGIGTRTTYVNNGFMNLPLFLRVRGKQISARTGAMITTTLRARMFAYEIGGIVVLGAFDYILFCARIRRKNWGRPNSDRSER